MLEEADSDIAGFQGTAPARSFETQKFNSVVWPGQTHLSCTRLDPFLIHYAQEKKSKLRR